MSDTFLASLLDRLDAARGRSGFVRSSFGPGEYRQMVMRDLKRLLNHSSFFVTASPGEAPARPTDVTFMSESFPCVVESVLNYGVDCRVGSTVSEVIIAAIGRNIRNAVECFEPRLKNVRVKLFSEPSEEDGGQQTKRDPEKGDVNKVCFLLEADLIMEPFLDDFRVLTELDLMSGQCDFRSSEAAFID